MKQAESTLASENTTAFPPDRRERRERYLTLAVLAGILFAGAVVRMDVVGAWGDAAGPAFDNGVPLLSTFDGYYYLCQARDLARGTYGMEDDTRGVPDAVPRSWPPPLLSLLLAVVHGATGIGLLGLGAWIPVLLGPLLAVPVYLVGKHLGGRWMGQVAAALAIVAPIYVFRTGLGRCDTDCLNVTFAMAVSYCMFRALEAPVPGRRLYLGSGVLLTLLFILWWDQARAVAGAMALAPLGLAWVTFRGCHVRRPGLTVVAATVFIVTLAWIGRASILALGDAVWSKLEYVLGLGRGEFPSVAQTITEQGTPPFPVAARLTAHHVVFFLLGAAGAILLALREKGRIGVLGSCLLVGVLGFFFAVRFLVYMVPVLAVGTAYLAQCLWMLPRYRAALRVACVGALACVAGQVALHVASGIPLPKETARVVHSMEHMKVFTPPGSVIWAWWDHGHAIRYFADRATVNDGGIHSGSRTVYTAWPLCTTNERAAANFMRFYITRGRQGIRTFARATGLSPDGGFRALAAVLGTEPSARQGVLERLQLAPGPGCQDVEGWLRYLFPPAGRPVYLFLDDRTFELSYWWYWFGTWSVERGNGERPLYKPLYLEEIQRHVIRCREGISIDTRLGVLSSRDTSVRLGAIRMYRPDSLSEGVRTVGVYGADRAPAVEWSEGAGYGVLTDRRMAETVFNKLFMRRQADSRFFKPLLLNDYAWQVTGD